ncbi:minor capsid protein [Staphylococcus succinus]|uniref:minor capsid protein n=1 Tax=Staphylococcus succinus TaxID=61015 RepID=UPI003F5C27A2
MPDTQEYWRKRAQEAMNQEAKDDREQIKLINEIVDHMVDDIEKEILAFYAKYATAEGVSLDEAKKKIDRTDIRKLENKAKQYVKDKDFSDEANKELKRYNTKMYVSREKMLQMQLGLILTYATAQLESQIHNYMESAVYREIKRQAGLVGATTSISLEHVQAIVNAPFEGVSWSARIWKDMEHTRKTVDKAVRHTLLRGRHPKEFVPQIRKKSEATAYQAKRLLLTETARAQSEAQKLHYMATLGKDAHVEFVAKLDERTSDECRSHNGNKIKVSEMVAGVNVPPLHPHCRSTTVPAVDEIEDELEAFFKKRKGKYNINLDDF